MQDSVNYMQGSVNTMQGLVNTMQKPAIVVLYLRIVVQSRENAVFEAERAKWCFKPGRFSAGGQDDTHVSKKDISKIKAR